MHRSGDNDHLREDEHRGTHQERIDRRHEKVAFMQLMRRLKETKQARADALGSRITTSLWKTLAQLWLNDEIGYEVIWHAQWSWCECSRCRANPMADELRTTLRRGAENYLAARDKNTISETSSLGDFGLGIHDLTAILSYLEKEFGKLDDTPDALAARLFDNYGQLLDFVADVLAKSGKFH